MDYIQNTDEDARLMLKSIGVASIDELFAPIPEDIRLKRPLDLPAGMSEQEVLSHLQQIAAKNVSLDRCVSFLGGGGYSHFTPSIVDALQSRGEFLTAYTPYQAEASQGTLQHIFEFQTMICELTGMDVANASHYDAATALAEAVALALDRTERKSVAVSSTVNPQYRAVLKTMFQHLGVRIVEIAHAMGATPLQTLKDVSAQAACVVVQNPNFFGIVEDLQGAAEAAHANGALAVAAVNPTSLAVLKSPGECGFDVAVGDAQPLGIPVSFSGPWCGFFAVKKDFIREMPGRIVGETVDADGKRGFVLTLQTREQHIRREKASSNICTNQALMALRATIYLAALGPGGLKRVAEISCHRTHVLAEKLVNLTGCRITYPKSPFFHEFVFEYPRPAGEVNAKLLRKGFIGGLDLAKYYPDHRNMTLLCCTEKNARADIDAFVAAVAEAIR